ncbi:MAG: energy transducer TonB [Bacteroidaceae bacterium]|nr:energy transducer TonB [Bacteroidaceae bacterium]
MKMRHIIALIFLLTFSIMPLSSSFAQKSKDKIEMPQFPGGLAELHKFITSELQYPAQARINKEIGEVLVAFSIGMDGYISGVRVVRSVSESLDAEAVRVVSKMPPWIPGKKNGRPVRAEMTIPINFKVVYVDKFVDEDADAEKSENGKFKY